MKGIYQIRVYTKPTAMGSKGRHDLSSLKLVAPADGHHVKADLAKSITIEDHATVKHECGLFHCVIHGTPVDVSELFPFRRDDDRLAVLGSGECRVGNGNLVLD